MPFISVSNPDNAKNVTLRIGQTKVNSPIDDFLPAGNNWFTNRRNIFEFKFFKLLWVSDKYYFTLQYDITINMIVRKNIRSQKSTSQNILTLLFTTVMISIVLSYGTKMNWLYRSFGYLAVKNHYN